jgi:hypothetical protein
LIDKKIRGKKSRAQVPLNGSEMTIRAFSFTYLQYFDFKTDKETKEVLATKS